MELIWIAVLLISLHPALTRRMLEWSRLRQMAQIERERQSRVILLVHRQETMSLLGFPLVRYIDMDDSEAVIRAIQLTDRDVPLDIILHTPGGLVLAATQIARAVHKHPARVTVHVPHMAMSGGTLIALAADEIAMDEHAVLGPVDPQLDGMPAASILAAVAAKPVAEVDDRTLILADISRKAIEQVRADVEELLSDDMDPEAARALATSLSEGGWTHDHPISCACARSMGLPVRCEIPESIYRLMSMFPQPVRQAAVTFIPERRTRDRAGS